MEKSIGERVGNLEVAVGKLQVIADDHKEDIRELKDDNTLLHRLVVNQEVLTTIVKENKEEMRNFSVTLSKINDNLDNLNKSSDDLRMSQESLKNEFKTDIQRIDGKVESVKKVQEEEQKKNTLDLSGLSKKVILKAVAIGVAVITTVVTAWVMIKFGLKQ